MNSNQQSLETHYSSGWEAKRLDVDAGKLEVGGASPQKLSMIAVAFHNLAVEHLLIGHDGEAAVAAQNARRLARLCLSYSNRWLKRFEGTHELALAKLQQAGDEKKSSRR